jgi:hypothetical protein
MAIVAAFQALMVLGLPMLAFEYTWRRGSPTRLRLVIASALGGGVSGAILAIVAAVRGASLENTLPFAVFNLGLGALIGLLALAVRSLGEWLSRRP